MGAHPVRCTVRPQATPSSCSRRSANYKASSWDFDFLQSLKIDCTVEMNDTRYEELKEQVRNLIVREAELAARLKLIDILQHLGLSYHFDQEIMDVLGSISIKNATTMLKEDLHATSLLFRLLREHGFLVPQDVFDGFKDSTGSFMGRLHGDFRGALSLYEASHVAFDAERTLDEARASTTKQLTYLMSDMAPHLKENVAHELELPLHWRAPRLEARRYIDQYERDDNMDPILLQLAKLDFNKVQCIHQMELTRLARWWKSLGLADQLSFARDRLMECYFFATGIVWEPHLGYCREGITKVCTLITIIDDVYDIFGSLDELELFTRAISRWENNSMEDLPEYMKICSSSLYNITNEMAHDILREDGWDALPYLRKTWVDLCNSFLVEAKWHHNGYTPSFQEYLNNAWMSASGHVVLFHALILSRQRVTKETLRWLQTYPSIFRSSSTIFRLCNDLATSTAELERGDVPTSVQCYMHEHGVSEATARQGIQDLINKTWNKLNKDVCDCYHVSPFLVTAAKNLARISHCMYKNGDGVGAPDLEMENKVISMFFERLSV